MRRRYRESVSSGVQLCDASRQQYHRALLYPENHHSLAHGLELVSKGANFNEEEELS